MTQQDNPDHDNPDLYVFGAEDAALELLLDRARLARDFDRMFPEPANKEAGVTLRAMVEARRDRT